MSPEMLPKCDDVLGHGAVASPQLFGILVKLMALGLQHTWRGTALMLDHVYGWN